jgi:class 3 adenylate cyclase
MGDAQRDETRDWLADRGATPEQLDAAEREGHLAGLASDLVLSRGAQLSAHDVAERTGIDLDLVITTFTNAGVPVPDPGAKQFTDADAAFIAGVCAASYINGPDGGDLMRVVAGALDRIAEAAVAEFVQGPEDELHRRGATQIEHADRVMHATELAGLLGDSLGVLFRHHMQQAIARQRVIQRGVSHRGMARLAIGFVDLVGSTALEARLGPKELGEMVSQFEARAFAVTAAAGGRIVKFIGDEIMVSALDAATGCRLMEALVDTFHDAGVQPRGGLVCGEVLYRHGDYYGPVVNLAARLVDAAIPGEVLVDSSVVRAAGEGGIDLGSDRSERLTFEPAGRRLLKGFESPVVVWTLAAR